MRVLSVSSKDTKYSVYVLWGWIVLAITVAVAVKFSVIFLLYLYPKKAKANSDGGISQMAGWFMLFNKSIPTVNTPKAAEKSVI